MSNRDHTTEQEQEAELADDQGCVGKNEKHKILQGGWPGLAAAFRESIVNPRCGCEEWEGGREFQILCLSETGELFCLRCLYVTTFQQGSESEREWQKQRARETEEWMRITEAEARV